MNKNRFIVNTFKTDTGYIAHVLDCQEAETLHLLISPIGTVQHIMRPDNLGKWHDKKALPQPVKDSIIKALSEIGE